MFAIDAILHQKCILPCFTFGKRSLCIFSTVSIWIPRRVDSFETDSWSRFCTCYTHTPHTHNVLHIYWAHRWSIDCCSSGSSRPAGGAVLTLSPQCDALLLVCLADAVVTVSIHTLTGVSVVQVDISGTVRIGACANSGRSQELLDSRHGVPAGFNYTTNTWQLLHEVLSDNTK